MWVVAMEIISENSQIKNQNRITNMIYITLILGLTIFFVVVMILIQNRNAENGNEIDNIFTFIVPFFGLMMMLISRNIYYRMISKFEHGGLSQKIGYYRTAKIISWAMIEGGCFFALVATILTSNYLYVAVFILLYGYFLMIRPTIESLIRDMRLNTDESELLLRK